MCATPTGYCGFGSKKSIAAATELSTPPDMATTTRFFTLEAAVGV
jgi:hypothetical protein